MEVNQLTHFEKPIKSLYELEVYNRIKWERVVAAADAGSESSDEDPDRTLVGELVEKAEKAAEKRETAAGRPGSIWKELSRRIEGAKSSAGDKLGGGLVKSLDGGRTLSSAILISSDDGLFV